MAFNPWEEFIRRFTGGDQSATPTPTPAPAPQGAGGSSLGSRLGGIFGGGDDDGSFFGPRLNRIGNLMLMGDPMYQNVGANLLQRGDQLRVDRRDRAAQNETAQWLMSQGVGAGEAKFLVGNQSALNAWYTAWKTGDKPDWQIHEIYNAKGQKQAAMVDMKTGKLNWLGGSAADKPNITLETIFDENGNEQKVLLNHDDPTHPIPLGGTKTGILTPEEMQQQLELRKAGASQVQVGAGETEQSKTLGGGLAKNQLEIQAAGRKVPAIKGRIAIMRNAVNAPGFQSGGAGTGQAILAGKQFLGALGIPTEGLADMETFNSLSKQAVYDTVGSLGTGFSEGDRLFTEQIVPNLGVSKGGNLALLEIQDKLQDRAGLVAKMARDYAKAHGGLLDLGFDDKVAEFAETNPIFSQADIDKITRLAAIADDAATPPGVRSVEPVTPAPNPPPPTPNPPHILPPDLQPRVQRPVINTLPAR